MQIITKPIAKALESNFKRSETSGDGGERIPAMKLFFAAGAMTWLITERDPKDPTMLYGLCDLGFGCPEIGWVSLDELQSIRKMGLGVERDRYWIADKTLSEYADEARSAGRIAA